MGFFSNFKRKKDETVPPEVTVQENFSGDYEETIPVYKPEEEETEIKKEPMKEKGKASKKIESLNKVSRKNINYAGSENVKADLERIKAQMEELMETRNFNSDRLSGVNEKIGELRGMIVENEKKMKDVQVMATMASDLVKEVQPESLNMEVKKVDAKIEALKAKLESDETLSSNIIEELKDIRNKAMVYTGTEGVIKLNNEVKEQLINIQRLKGLIEKHSDKVESIFIEINKNFTEYKKMNQNVDVALKNLNDLQKDVTDINVKLKNMADKRDMDSKILEFDKEINDLKKLNETVSTLTVLIADNKQGILELEKHRDKVNNNLELLGDYLKNLTKVIKTRSSDRRLAELGDKITLNERRIEGLLDLVKIIGKTEESQKMIEEIEEKKEQFEPGIPEELEEARIVLKKTMKNFNDSKKILERAKEKGDKYGMMKANDILEQEDKKVKQALRNVISIKKKLGIRHIPE